jgi:hypothetical protein
MTILEKIEFLKKLRALNTKLNLFTGLKYGLCKCNILLRGYNFLLSYQIPELEKERITTEDYYGYWWCNDEFNFLKFRYQRHKAINRTINKLKKIL